MLQIKMLVVRYTFAMQRFTAIDGRGGSGKTYLAKLLAERLGAQLFHLDEYGNDYEPFIGIPKLFADLLKAKEDIVIFEGVGVFDDRFNQFKAFRVLVDVPETVRTLRAESRDVPTTERSEEEWSKIYQIWEKAEREYFTDATRAKADVVVGELDGEFDLEAIVDRIKNNFLGFKSEIMT